MGFFKRPTLRHRDDKRTRAAELTLRESIYPLMLVTVLFFLWVKYSTKHPKFTTPLLTPPGLLLRPHRHPKQAFPRDPWYNPLALSWSASRLLWRIPLSFPGPRELDPAPLGLQSVLHLGFVAVWRGCATSLAVPGVSLFRWFLCCDVCDWEWVGEFGDGGESISR